MSERKNREKWGITRTKVRVHRTKNKSKAKIALS